jgi:hypothetical protein
MSSSSSSSATAATLEKKNVVDAAEKEKTSADYYFNSYSHFGKTFRNIVGAFLNAGSGRGKIVNKRQSCFCCQQNVVVWKRTTTFLLLHISSMLSHG